MARTGKFQMTHYFEGYNNDYKCKCDKNIQVISLRKLFHPTMYQSCCVESQPQTTHNAHLQTWSHLKLLTVQ